MSVLVVCCLMAMQCFNEAAASLHSTPVHGPSFTHVELWGLWGIREGASGCAEALRLNGGLDTLSPNKTIRSVLCGWYRLSPKLVSPVLRQLPNTDMGAPLGFRRLQGRPGKATLVVCRSLLLVSELPNSLPSHLHLRSLSVRGPGLAEGYPKGPRTSLMRTLGSYIGNSPYVGMVLGEVLLILVLGPSRLGNLKAL